MTDDEYMQEFCNKCKNRKRFEDICEIRKNIKGEPQCVNFEEEKKGVKVMKKEMKLIEVLNLVEKGKIKKRNDIKNI